MRYISTRGGVKPIPCKEAVMMGLARDGVLLRPEALSFFFFVVFDRWQKQS